MDNHICSICKQETKEDSHFWKEHRIKQSNYFEQYHPRFCKQTNELLSFKNFDSYFSNDFKGKREMVAWFKAYPDDAKTYAIELLKKRKEKKGLIYTPSQVELRSIMSPSIIWFKENFDSYNQLCKSLGFQERFDLENEIPIFKEIEGTILIDTREQRHLRFNYDNCKRIG